jgi:hypothetical protein
LLGKHRTGAKEKAGDETGGDSDRERLAMISHGGTPSCWRGRYGPQTSAECDARACDANRANKVPEVGRSRRPAPARKRVRNVEVTAGRNPDVPVPGAAIGRLR